MPSCEKADRLRILALAAALLLPPGHARAQDARAQDRAVEYAIKATYLYKFLPFIEWPGALTQSDRFTICVVGMDPFGELLDRAVAGQLIEDRSIAVRHLAVLDPDAACRVVFAGGSPTQSIAAILAVLRGKPVLSVTDGSRDPLARGIINFVIDNGRVRFEIDDQAAVESGLAISSKLLRLATDIYPRH